VNKQNEKMIDVNSMTYEEAYNELARIVESLEEEEHSLEISMEMFERGKILSNYCKEMLNKAELRIKDIDGDELILLKKG
jgi:exodeoxyribonuclease VII small subunit